MTASEQPALEIAPDPPLDLAGVETWVFDLDNTLYPASSNLFAQIDVRMRDFIADFLDLEPDEARRVQKRYFREYGTTMRGLMTAHGLDPKGFLDYVHDIDITPVPPSPALDRVLARVPGRKLIFTNASLDHADRVMKRLGVGHHFDGVFDIADAGYVPKPLQQPYDLLVERFELEPSRTVMLEDIARNLEPAARMGMTTVWVRTETPWATVDSDRAYVHHHAKDLVAWLEGVVGE